KSAMQADLETLYEINQQIQINNRSFYKISHDNVVVGYVDQNDFNKLGQGDPDTTETENITPTIPSNSSVNDTNHSPSERRTETSISYSTHVRGHGWMPTSKMVSCLAQKDKDYALKQYVPILLLPFLVRLSIVPMLKELAGKTGYQMEQYQERRGKVFK
ncbi:hypothetical protein SNF32_16515, partial [Enterococcus mundtii]|nr:hypothetical protein [Enterococcus mundtii]